MVALQQSMHRSEASSRQATKSADSSGLPSLEYKPNAAKPLRVLPFLALPDLADSGELLMDFEAENG
jgi:hypothetical protein